MPTEIHFPSWRLPAQSEQQEHWIKVLNMFKVNNKHTRTMPMVSFWCLYYLWTYVTPCSTVSIVNFEQVIAGWLSKIKFHTDFHTSKFQYVLQKVGRGNHDSNSQRMFWVSLNNLWDQVVKWSEYKQV